MGLGDDLLIGLVAAVCIGGAICLTMLGALAAAVYLLRRRSTDAGLSRVGSGPAASGLPAARPDQAYLELLSELPNRDPAGPTRIALTAETTRFGRDAVLCDEAFDHPSISRVHARITRTPDGAYMLYDEGSTSGAWVNYKPVPTIGMVLRPGDVVNFGKVQLRFELQPVSDLSPDSEPAAQESQRDRHATVPFVLPPDLLQRTIVDSAESPEEADRDTTPDDAEGEVDGETGKHA